MTTSLQEQAKNISQTPGAFDGVPDRISKADAYNVFHLGALEADPGVIRHAVNQATQTGQDSSQLLAAGLNKTAEELAMFKPCASSNPRDFWDGIETRVKTI